MTMHFRCTLLAVAAILAAACSTDSADEAGGGVRSAANAIDRQTLESLERELTYSEGIRDIKRLQRAYAHYLGAGEWDLAAALFASTGTASFADETHRGAEAIAGSLASLYGASEASRQGWLNTHLLLSPVINIIGDGTRAQGRWRLVSLQGQFEESANWEGGIFENAYVREDGVWKIDSLHYYPVYGGDYADGWRILEEETDDTVEPIPFHYTADLAGIPTFVAGAPPAAAANGASRAESPAGLGELQARARQLVAEDAVANLQSAYGYYMDRHLWDDLADLFTEDARFEIDRRGVYEGRSRIRAALDSFGDSPIAPGRIDDRLQLQSVVTIAPDGQSAAVRGTELQMLGEYEGPARWGIGIFENTFVIDDGRWKIDSVHVYPRMLSDYAIGWASDAREPPGPAADLPPDEPATMTAVYPDFFVPEFSFPHPVLDARARQAAVTDEAGDVDELRRLLRVLNAYEGAENVANAYGYYIDEFLWDGMADLFSAEGWKELSYIGTYIGRERVRYSVVSRYGRGGRRANSMTYHQKVQPFITVSEDGSQAEIRTRLFQLNASTFDPGSYIAGIYENRVVRENGIWKISAMDLDYTWLADYDGGWSQVEPGSSERFAPAPGSLQGEQAPDGPLRGVIFAPYPLGAFDMAFHYRNPVSGRAPPIYLPDVY